MRRDQESKNPPQKMEGNQISPYDVIRLKNCKLFKFRRDEMYPSVRPPVSHCDPEETAAFLSASMEANGLGSFDSRILRQRPIGVSSLDRSNEMGIVKPCRTRKVQEPLYKSGTSPHMVLDWSKMTPYDLMRLQNCKTFDFQKCEKYPNVRPPVSPCNAEWTAQWLANAVENCGCQRLFDMEIDDILDIWKRSPAKESLGFYGVDSGIATPEAIEYNQLVSKCLDKVSRRKREQKEDVKKPLAKSKEKTRTPGILLLNRSKLQSQITKMPTVQKKLHPSTALSCIHCPRQTTSKPFLEAPRSAPDMEKPVRKSKHREWRKYKEVPVSSEAELEKLAKEFENEPKNYDELYSQLIACFEKDLLRDRLDASYYKCCKQFSKSGGAQGSGKGAKGGGGRQGDGEGDGRGTGDGNEVGDGDGEGAEVGELEEAKGVGFGGTEGQGEGGGEGGGASSYGLGDGGQGAAVADKDKAAAGAAIGGAGSGDGKNKKPGDVKADKADKAAEKVGKKTAGKSAKDQAKKPANSQEPKDQAKKQIKLFELPNALESVTEGESNLSEQKSITDLQNDDDDIKDSSLSSFWKRPSQEDLGRKRKAKIGKVGKRRGSKAKGRARKSAEQRFSTDSTPTKTKDQDCPCPCEICELMNRRERDPPDPPYILEMLKEQRYRQIIEYHQRLCHRAYLLRNCPQYPAPAHRCDPIECDEPASFSLDPKIAEYFDRLTAINDLQKLLCAKKHSQVDHQLLFLVQNLKDRLCWRLNQLL
ncbi:hypothetical protein ACLKA6_013655 [Drosophila palustris]